MSSTGTRYAYYVPPDTSGVDCDAMRTLEAHADHLEGLMDSQLRLLPEYTGCQPEEAGYEWVQTRQWLSMVAGLNFVDVTPNRFNYWGPMCERADAYDGAKNDVVSDVATEETRLLYAWGATERLLQLLRLPDVPDKRANGKLYNRASLLISTAFTEPNALEHYSHVVNHLRGHVTADVGLSEDRALISAGEERPWRNSNAVLLPLRAAIRNVPAHGASEYPEPEDWHTESPAASRPLHSAAHDHDSPAEDCCSRSSSCYRS